MFDKATFSDDNELASDCDIDRDILIESIVNDESITYF